MYSANYFGVIGMGIVGNALFEGMKDAYLPLTYDKYRHDKCNCDSVAVMVGSVGPDDPIFVCVPTPMNDDGSCNTEIVESVVEEIASTVAGIQFSEMKYDFRPLVVIKSTVPPGTTDKLHARFYSQARLVFNPEFLTEAKPVEDFKNQDRIVLGGNLNDTLLVAAFFAKVFPQVTTVQVNAKTAEMVKYLANCYLATKVSFANEMYQICQGLGIDYTTVVTTATLDKRLGKSHWKVPGPDGHFGFGLSCFPKDLNGLLHVATQLGVDAKVLKAVWAKNLEVRPEKDWEKLKGRAVL